MKNKIITLILNFYTNLFGQEIFITAKRLIDKESNDLKNEVNKNTRRFEIQCDMLL